ncbi:MAG: hypothetical protein JRH16_00625 [Deltaproteobacteria bacterium]|nr:hypothetical protein [Deltaproteobacteria bacterium]MBW2363413.1 hypothetical protein [Deltaproteobacteria bacterium]
MSGLNALRLFLVTFAILGIVYAISGTGAFSRDQPNWWGELPKHKKIVFSAAIAATLLQSFL